MKRMLWYITIIAFSVLLGFILSNMRPRIIPTLLSVDTEYAWIGDGTSLGQIMLYVNDPDHGIAHEDHVIRMLLGDEKRARVLEVSVEDIEIGHQEHYLQETYFRLLITFKLPHLPVDLIFDEGYVHLELFDRSEYGIAVGRITLFSPDPHEEVITWTSLEGFKKENHLRSRLKTIHVAYQGDITLLSRIDVGSQANTSFWIDDDLIVIAIDDAPYLLYAVPIKLMYTDGRTQIVSTFRFMTDYMILKESGPWIHHYELY